MCSFLGVTRLGVASALSSVTFLRLKDPGFGLYSVTLYQRKCKIFTHTVRKRREGEELADPSCILLLLWFEEEVSGHILSELTFMLYTHLYRRCSQCES